MSQNPSYKFSVATSITGLTQLVSLGMGILSSIILARVLGPEGRGVYALSILLPSLIVTFSKSGIGMATVYYTARDEFPLPEILGNNILLSVGIGSIGVAIGLLIIYGFHTVIFPGIAPLYLLLALLLVPLQIFSTFVRYILLGAQRIKEFNYIQGIQSTAFMTSIALALLILKSGIVGAIAAGVIAWLLVSAFSFYLAHSIAGGVTLRPNGVYLKGAITYGIQAHLSNILAFLNYRIDIFLLNSFLGPTEVGMYDVGVGLAERLWMLSRVASSMLFPRVAAEVNEKRRKKITPLIARTVFWATAGGALILALFSRQIVLVLYSKTFLPVASVLQVLLVGIVMLSVSRILAVDIAGRGKPILNAYRGVITVGTNVALNVLWIPRYGIIGSAWASTVSYTISFLSALLVYCYVSDSSWSTIMVPQAGDWALYKKTGKTLWHGGWSKARKFASQISSMGRDT